MSRRRYIAIAAVAGVGLLALVAWLNRPRDEPARASVKDAVRAFRAGAENRDLEAASGEPAPGVYRYATRGEESAKTAIGGATHDYYGVSTIAVGSGRCGVERWQVLTGRWTEAETCLGPKGYELKTVTEFHEFFDVGQKDSFRCHGAPAPRLADLQPGISFSGLCESDGSTISSVAEVVGFGTVFVGDEAFPVVHTRARSRVEGETSGSALRDDWRRRSDGLLLRRSVTSDADSDAGGGTHYTERYTLHLIDLEPRR